MTVQRITVTYAAPLTLQSTELWEQIRSAINAQLPLRNLHWKSPSRPSIRTVQELQIDLVPYEAGRDEHTPQVLGAIMEKPLLNLYIVTCEDAETYKVSVKKQIKDWHTPISQRKNQEWLVVHVVPPDIRAAPGTFLKMKATVIDKIRADYNTDKRDRCVQLAWSADKDHPAVWVDFVTKMKEGILTAFDSVVCQREEDLRRSEGQRHMPGWNFCTYSILKESLAILFDGMSLFEDALAQYRELEFTFSQVLQEKNMSWFGKLISPGPKDDSQALLSLVKKPYRNLILANTISVFDFRVYLLARQCAILGKMGKIVDVCKKSSTFLATFGRRLREAQGNLPQFFIESWLYSSALSVTEQCDAWAIPTDFGKSTSSNYQAAKGELLQLAANQLDIIGVSVRHLPFEQPFSASMSLPLPMASELSDFRGAPHSISKPEILSAISDKDAFYDLYVNITKRAIDSYARAGRRQFALKLHGTLAALDVHRGHFPKAHQTYSSLPAHYVPHGWASLGCYMHYRALHMHSKLAKPRDREWIYLVLDFLTAYVSDLSREFMMSDEDQRTYISGLFDSLKAAATDSDSDILYLDHSAITVRVPSTTTQLAQTQDGSSFNIVVLNHLPCQVSIDGIRIVLVGTDSERIVFSARETLLAPGSNVVKVSCISSVPGAFVLESSEIHLGKLLLQWTHKRKSRPSRLVKEAPVIVHIPKDPQAVNVSIGQPPSIELGVPRSIHVTIFTGRNDVSHIILRFSSHAGLQFHYPQVVMTGRGQGTMEPTVDSLNIKDIERNSSVSFLLPHSDASGHNAMRVNVRAEYVTVAEPSLSRSLRISSLVPILLAIAVNVEDFFRAKRLFTRFTISTTSHQHVRIRSAQLEIVGEPQNDLKIVSCTACKPELVIVTPIQPAQFLFRLDSTLGQVRDSLRLRITYRVFRKEVEALIEHAVKQVLMKSPDLLSREDVLVETLVKALEEEANWVTLYSITGQLESPPIAKLDGELDVVLREAKEILMNDSRVFDDAKTWCEVVFPVDVPQMSIIAAVRVKIAPSPLSSRTTSSNHPLLYAGQPISAVLSVHTTFHWGPDDAVAMKEITYDMRFDVEEVLKDWLVSGQKRGDFVAKDEGTFSIPITLVALHHGELSLPRASVTPLPVAGTASTMSSSLLPSCETYQEHGAEKVLVLPREGRSTFLVGMGGNN